MLEQEAADIIGRIVAVRAVERGIHPDSFTHTFIDGSLYMHLHPAGTSPTVEAAVAASPSGGLVRESARKIWFSIVDARRRENQIEEIT